MRMQVFRKLKCDEIAGAVLQRDPERRVSDSVVLAVVQIGAEESSAPTNHVRV